LGRVLVPQVPQLQVRFEGLLAALRQSVAEGGLSPAAETSDRGAQSDG
jgi:hypothetical protein